MKATWVLALLLARPAAAGEIRSPSLEALAARAPAAALPEPGPVRGLPVPPSWTRFAEEGWGPHEIERLVDVRLDRSCLKELEGGMAPEEAEAARRAMRDLFIASVEDGLTRLGNWSPALSAAALKKVKDLTLTLGCEPADKKYAGYYRWWFGHKIVVTKLERRTSFILNFYELMGGELEAQPLWHATEASPTVQSAREGARRAKHIMFHEFLHFAGFSMSDDHNDRSLRESDRVYSCGALAFPSENFPVVWGKTAAADRLMSARACETCVGDDAPARAKCRAAFP